ncbi:hypothetical protein AGMMS49579_24860 [Spirochaetia bacterium]|nr:hypothetical protein AGMMS49579_24860 [Spirochaetia bacterium]
MSKIYGLMLGIIITGNLFAQLPLDRNEFGIKNVETGKVFGLGDEIKTLITSDKIYEIKEREYSNITYQEYKNKFVISVKCKI